MPAAENPRSTLKKGSLKSRDARKRLLEHEAPYWEQLLPGVALGYKKGARFRRWSVRYVAPDGKYRREQLGAADDTVPADGTTVLSYTDAHKAALAVANGRHATDSGAAGDAYTVADAMREYLAWFAANRKSGKATAAACKRYIHWTPKATKKKPFRHTLGHIRVNELTAEQISRWHERVATTKKTDPDAIRKRKATANRVLSSLKAMLNRAWRAGKVADDSAWRRVRPFRGVSAPTIRYISASEVQRLINASPAGLRELVHAAILTGCRYGELRNLRVMDYNLRSGTLHIRESKSGKPRHVPVTDEGKAFFEQQIVGRQGDEFMLLRPDGKPWQQSDQQRPMRAACEAARINPPINFHLLRHAYGSLLALNGVPLQVIANVLGHSDTRMTEKHYAHLQPNYIADTVRANLPQFTDTANSNIVRLGAS